jgi:cytochrome o ubiquinol oxidase subunit II
MRFQSDNFLRNGVLAAIVPLLASCGDGVTAPKGPIAKAELTILQNATAIMLAVIVPVIVLTIVFAWWFRAANRRARYLPSWEYSGRIEMIVWSIPTLVIVFLGGIAWVSSHELDPPRAIGSGAHPLEVDVVSLDWKWLFIYPSEGIASVNRLVVPVGVPVEFHLTSGSVMNSFFVPELGSQIYTMAGMVTRLNLQADQAGTYQGLSAQFSGDGFSDMRFEVSAVPPDQYSAWIGEAKSKQEQLDIAGYDELARPSKAVPPISFGQIAPDLFEAIVAQRTSAGAPEQQVH